MSSILMPFCGSTEVTFVKALLQMGQTEKRLKVDLEDFAEVGFSARNPVLLAGSRDWTGLPEGGSGSQALAG